MDGVSVHIKLDMEKIRISKFFTDCGIMSRRAAEAEISAGKVKVNGEVAILGQKINPDEDIVEYMGKRISPPVSEKVCIMLNKPRGIVSTAADEKGRTNVTELCRDLKGADGNTLRMYPVGRLDMDSDGLLLLTNDGELANKLTHPRHEIPKIYHVTLAGIISDGNIEALGAPIEIDGRTTLPVRVKKLRTEGDSTVAEFVLYEGRNRQIRRMCESCGVKITRLTRVAIGEITLGDLPLGKWRRLTAGEIEYLKK